MLANATTGLLTGLGLIVAIGAQNAFVLRQGIRRDHVGLVIAVCALSDVVLIAAGTAGIGVLVESVPWLLTALRWIGAAYLVWFAIGSLRSAARTTGLEADGAGVDGVAAGADGAEADAPLAAGARSPAVSRGWRILGTTLALTWLNPHVYLDTVLMLGNLANQHGRIGRWEFAAGAMLASLAWFTLLGIGARALAPLLARPRVWQAVDIVIGLMMLVIAVMLALG